MSGYQVIYGLESLLGDKSHYDPRTQASKDNDRISTRLSRIEALMRSLEAAGLEQAVVTNLTSEQIRHNVGSDYISGIPVVDSTSRNPEIPFGIRYEGKNKKRIIIGCRPIDLYPMNENGDPIMITDVHNYISSIITLTEIMEKLTKSFDDGSIGPPARFDQIYAESKKEQDLEGVPICNTRLVHPKKPVFALPVKEFLTKEHEVLIGYASLGKNGKSNGAKLRIIKITKPLRLQQ
jgi:hypothetical protein